MEQVGHKVAEGWRSFAKMFMGTLKESKFYSEGVLTPEEYIAAGDFLTEKCPTWKWCSSKKEFRENSLPESKQFLMTTVPCPKRASDYLRANNTTENVIEDDWVEANVNFYNRKGKDEVIDIDPQSEETNKNKQIVVQNSIEGNADIDIVQEEDNKDKEQVIEPVMEDDFIVIDNSANENIIKTRTYDVSVTYDLYYQVPRMWLIGYSEEGIPLSDAEMKEDIMLEYIDRTVTIEKHPCTGVKSISIHPCKHSHLLKKMIDNFEASGKVLEVYMCIVLILKFLHSVVPTIQYDFTMNIDF